MLKSSRSVTGIVGTLMMTYLHAKRSRLAFIVPMATVTGSGS